MTKKEVSEIKRLYSPSNCSITRICSCYVDGEKNKKMEETGSFLSLPEDDMFKYFDILRKSLSGGLGKNLLNLEFSPDTEISGGTQDFLLQLRNSKLQDEELLESFYDQVIENYDYLGNYLILLIYDSYDIPGRTSDGRAVEDASDEVYNYIQCCICPVSLSKPGLSYNQVQNAFQNRIQDWVVGVPELGFLFPAFNNRSADIHSLLYYSKNADDLHDGLIEQLLGCPLPLPAEYQKESFRAIIEKALGDDCHYETVWTIYENLNEMLEKHKEELKPLTLDKGQVKSLLSNSGIEAEKLQAFDRCFEETVGEGAILLANYVVSTQAVEVRTPDVNIKVNPDRSNLIRTLEVAGRQCLMIEIDGSITVNGIVVNPNLYEK